MKGDADIIDDPALSDDDPFKIAADLDPFHALDNPVKAAVDPSDADDGPEETDNGLVDAPDDPAPHDDIPNTTTRGSLRPAVAASSKQSQPPEWI